MLTEFTLWLSWFTHWVLTWLIQILFLSATDCPVHVFYFWPIGHLRAKGLGQEHIAADAKGRVLLCNTKSWKKSILKHKMWAATKLLVFQNWYVLLCLQTSCMIHFVNKRCNLFYILDPVESNQAHFDSKSLSFVFNLVMPLVKFN